MIERLERLNLPYPSLQATIDAHIRYLRVLYEAIDLDRHPSVIAEERAEFRGAVAALQNLRSDLFGSELPAYDPPGK